MGREHTSHRGTVFLLGGEDALDAASHQFVLAAGGTTARIEILLHGGDQWQQCVPRYVEPLTRHGVSHWHVTVPDGSGALDATSTERSLREATGILIGGGDTLRYQQLYTAEPAGGLIRERHEAGVPVAGMSAGALLALENCVIFPEGSAETGIRIEPGLGLLRGIVVGVHFTEWGGLPRVLDAMVATQTREALGLDESAVAVFEDGVLRCALGGPVHRLVMRDFDARSYDVSELPPN